MRKTFALILLCIATFQIQAQFTNFRVEDKYSSKNDIRAIDFNKDNELFIATHSGVYKQDMNGWQLCSSPTVYLESLLIDKADHLWISDWGTGVFRSDNGSSDYEQIKEVPTSANILFEDTQGRIWAGMWRGGMMMYDKNKWINFTTKDKGFADNSILSVTSDSQNRIWVGTYRGLSLFDGKQWQCYDINNSKLPDNNIYALAIGKNDRLWIGTCEGLIEMKKNGEIDTILNTANSPLPDNVILTLFEDAKGRLWIGTNNGLNRYDGIHWKRYTMENSNILENRIQVLTSHNNKLYVGTSSGLSIIDID